MVTCARLVSPCATRWLSRHDVAGEWLSSVASNQGALQLRVPTPAAAAAAVAGLNRARRCFQPRRGAVWTPALADISDSEQSAAAEAGAVALAACRGPLPGPAADEHYMRLALAQARRAAAAGEVPVGAVLVSSEGEVLAAAGNHTEGSADPTAHAELACIRGAAAARGAWRLLHATLYVTLEPCPMCAGALLQSRVGTVVYGARNTLLGADGSWIAMLPGSAAEEQASGHEGSDIESQEAGSSVGPRGGRATTAAVQPVRPHPFHPGMGVRRGVLAAECSSLMRSFFAQRRKQAAAAAGQGALQAEGAAAGQEALQAEGAAAE